MRGPAVAGWLLVVLTVAAVAHSVVLLTGTRRSDRHVDVAEAVMGAAMAAMAAPLTLGLPDWLWAGLPAADAAWLATVLALRVFFRMRARAPREHWGHYVHHVFAAAVMVYMVLMMGPAMRLLAAPTAMAMPGMASTGASGPLPLLLAGYFFAYTMRAGARLTSPSDRCPEPVECWTAALASPGLLNARRVIMGTGMLYMLLAMA